MDGTVAVDAILTQRLCRGTACGHTATGCWGLWQEYGVIVAYVLCERCHVTDRELRGVRTVMEQRSGSGEEHSAERCQGRSLDPA
jgi:hypothetical protein